jgi:CDP-4-dehydro-6-deoxyglucose reductase, E3
LFYRGLPPKLPQSERLDFLAGQHIDILLRDGQRRSYSLAHAPHDTEFLRLHVRHVPGGLFSESVFTRMQTKTCCVFRGPWGLFLCVTFRNGRLFLSLVVPVLRRSRP